MTLTIAEHTRILLAVDAAKKDGRKMTASTYIASVLRNNWETENLFRRNDNA